MGKEAEKSSAHFGNGRSDFLLRSLLEQANNGARVENVFKKEAWVTVVNEFNKHYHEDYEISALKNHYNAQRVLYKTFEPLKNFTGAGWDDEKKMVIASDEWWKIKIASNSKYKTFRNKGFPNYALMNELEDGRNADDKLVRGSRVARTNRSRTAELTPEELALDDGLDSDLPPVLDPALTEVLNDKANGSTVHDPADQSNFGPIPRDVVDPANAPAPSSLPPTSPSPPPKPTNAKQPAPFSPKPRAHRKQSNLPSSADALMSLVEVGKAKLAAKEEDRKQNMRMQEDRQAQLELIRHERQVQLETIRSERKAQAEAAALERLQHQSLIHASKDKYPEQTKAMNVFRSKVASNITDKVEKMKGAIILNNEDKAFFFNSLPEDMQWDWLKNEITQV